MLFAMIFSKYPFERPEDGALTPAERGQRMMKRIARVGSHGAGAPGHYPLPPCPGCLASYVLPARSPGRDAALRGAALRVVFSAASPHAPWPNPRCTAPACAVHTLPTLRCPPRPLPLLPPQGEWTLPDKPAVTESCADLLRKLLTKDPAKRLTLAATMRHPWFAESLPPGSLAYNDAVMQASAPEPR